MKCMLSIIVPIFNVEPYLEICLRSLVGQTLRDIEIILIDDGSTDHSGEIAQGFADRDSRIRLVRQRNHGQGMARNRGLDMANGKYIAFVDSDDWVILSAYERLVAVAERFEVDMVMGNVLFCYDNGKRIDRYKRTDKTIFDGVLSGPECLVRLNEQNAFSPMIVTYLYKRELLMKHHIRFEATIHEDELWVPQTFCLARSVKVIDFNFYGYRQRKGSTMNSLNYRKRYEALMYIAEQLMTFTIPYMEDPSYAKLVGWLYVKMIWLFHFASTQLRFLPENVCHSYVEKLGHMESQRPYLYPIALARYQTYRNLIEEQLNNSLILKRK